MRGVLRRLIIAVPIFSSLVGCGLYTPGKSEIRSDEPIPPHNGFSASSEQGSYENDVVSHIYCELAYGLVAAKKAFPDLKWLDDWGTAVTLTITAQDQTGFSPGVSFIKPLQNVVQTFPAGGNVTSPQSVSLGLGASAAATATRTETIQFTYLNSDLLVAGSQDCGDPLGHGAQIDGDLKIREFLFDKFLIARAGNASLYSKLSRKFKANKFKRPDRPWQWPVYNTFTEEVDFIAAYGGSITPTWKLAQITANTSSILLGAERTYTNNMILTMGPVKPPTDKTAAVLDSSAQAQHNARVTASALASSLGH